MMLLDGGVSWPLCPFHFLDGFFTPSWSSQCQDDSSQKFSVIQQIILISMQGFSNVRFD